MAVKAKWAGGLQFVGTDERNHTVVMDAPPPSGDGAGIKPPHLLLLGLAGCTGMDIVTILQKGRQRVVSVEVEADGEHSKDSPWGFVAISLKYTIKGDRIPEEAVQRAIKLSEERYCSVRGSLSAKVESTYEIVSTPSIPNT
jgi:putative redox protein